MSQKAARCKRARPRGGGTLDVILGTTSADYSILEEPKSLTSRRRMRYMVKKISPFVLPLLAILEGGCSRSRGNCSSRSLTQFARDRVREEWMAQSGLKLGPTQEKLQQPRAKGLKEILPTWFIGHLVLLSLEHFSALQQSIRPIIIYLLY